MSMPMVALTIKSFGVNNKNSSSDIQLSPIYLWMRKEFKHIFHVFSRKQEFQATYLCKKNKRIKLQTFA